MNLWNQSFAQLESLQPNSTATHCNWPLTSVLQLANLQDAPHLPDQVTWVTQSPNALTWLQGWVLVSLICTKYGLLTDGQFPVTLLLWQQQAPFHHTDHVKEQCQGNKNLSLLVFSFTLWQHIFICTLDFFYHLSYINLHSCISSSSSSVLL